MKFNYFWSYILYHPSLISFIESFLKFHKKPFDIDFFPKNNDGNNNKEINVKQVIIILNNSNL